MATSETRDNERQLTAWFILAVGLLLATAFSVNLGANESGHVILQSGDPKGGTPIHDRGLFGEGQVVAVLDNGLDYDSCYFSEVDGRRPPVNLTLDDAEFDSTRRKVIAYNFLYSCVEYPDEPGCESPDDPSAWDDQGHGTHAAAGVAGDKDVPILHDYADGIASGAKLVIQDAGFIGGDDCTSRPGLHCPVRILRPLLRQAWDQGARIHSNSWGDRQGTPATEDPPTGNYTRGASDIDEFVFVNPDMVVVFNSGNAGSLGPGSQSSPGNAKNTIQVGAALESAGSFRVVNYSGTGPTRDQRIKPDFVGPASIVGAETDNDVTTGNCNTSLQPGTSFSAPPVAGAAAIVRQYYQEGWYPSGMPDIADRLDPTAALVKATLMASTIHVPQWDSPDGRITVHGLPSYEQGFGFPVLDRALYFAGEERNLFALDRRVENGLTEDSRVTVDFSVSSSTDFRVALVWPDIPSAPSDTANPQLINDLDLIVYAPDGSVRHGNDTLHPGVPDRRNNAEMVAVEDPVAGQWRVVVATHRLLVQLPQEFALVVTGDFRAVDASPRRRPVRR